MTDSNVQKNGFWSYNDSEFSNKRNHNCSNFWHYWLSEPINKVIDPLKISQELFLELQNTQNLDEGFGKIVKAVNFVMGMFYVYL